MSANSFGSRFRVTTFGESHGPALGVVIDGCPSGIEFDLKLLQRNLQRRRPGTSSVVSARNEVDQCEILSGVFENQTLGTPVALIVRNQDARSEDYKNLSPRAGHADDVWKNKFGHTDPRGGGRSSGRETVARVMAGSLAQMLVQKLRPETRVLAWSQQIGPFALSSDEQKELNFERIETAPARFPGGQSNLVKELLEKAKADGESYGGIVGLTVKNAPAFLGQPVFHKFKADLAHALLGIGAATAMDLGEGFDSVHKPGTEFHKEFGGSQYGGIRGGITTGEDLSMKVYFKPTSSILDVSKKGRHDPCIVPRAVPVVESMAWLVLADHLLWQLSDRV